MTYPHKKPRMWSSPYEAALHYKYKITLAEYNEILAKQDNKCAICLTDQKDLPLRLGVDHCHDTGRIRGLLCRACNTGISRFRDHPEYADRAAQYLLFK